MKNSNRMLSMHNNLMKRYQKELKTNTAQVEQITTLSVSVTAGLQEVLNETFRLHTKVKRT